MGEKIEKQDHKQWSCIEFYYAYFCTSNHNFIWNYSNKITFSKFFTTRVWDIFSSSLIDNNCNISFNTWIDKRNQLFL